MKTLYVEFEDGGVCEIELRESEFVEQWCEVHNRAKASVNNKFLSRLGLLFYHGFDRDAMTGTAETKANAVREINLCIDRLKQYYGLDYPYRAFDGMTWQDTNLIHRCFTTGLTTKQTWQYPNVTRDDLRAFKFFENPDNDLAASNAFFGPIDPQCQHQCDNLYESYDGYTYGNILERINKYVHIYEDVAFSPRAKTELDKYGVADCSYFEVEWDIYDGNGTKSYAATRIASDAYRFNDYDPHQFDVYISKSITGKDYFQCYHEYDDPLEWDIQNFNNLNGGFLIMPSKLYSSWFETNTSRSWLSEHGVPLDRRILQPPAIGRVVRSSWTNGLYQDVRSDNTRINSAGNPMLSPQGTVVGTEIQ